MQSNIVQSKELSRQLAVVLCSFFFLTDLIGQSWALAGLPDARNLQDSMSRTLCAHGPLKSFASNVTLDYSVVCEALSPSDIDILQKGIMEAYNDFLQPKYCDPFSRRVSKVTYLSETSAAKDGSELAVRFLVEGTCRGCDSESHLSFFDAKFSDHMSQHKVMQEGDETTTCPCPVDAIANRAATQDEFLTVYESILARDAPELICVTTDAEGLVPTGQPSAEPTVLGIDCPLNLSTPLISQLVLTLNQNATQSSYEALGQDLINTYNALINETYTTCQTIKYRQMTDIRIDSEATFARRRMRDRQLQDIVPSENQLFFFQVEGGCAGCDMEELFFDPNVLSQNDFVGNYSTLVDTGLDFFSEIVTSDCPSNISSFETAVIIEFSPENIDSDGLSSDELLMQQLEEIYVKTYNDLRREYCDPSARQLTSAKIVLVGENNTFGNIPVVMELSGTCSNCDGLGLSVYDLPVDPNGTDVVFFADSPVRRLFQSDSPLGRVIEGGDSSCYCPAHPVGIRGPYEAEFLDAYREAINETSPTTSSELEPQLQLVEVLNLGLGLEVADCQFGSDWNTGYPIRVEVPSNIEDLTEDEKDKIVETLKEMIDSLYSVSDGSCNPGFRIVETAALGPNQSNGRRKLQRTLAPVPRTTSRPVQAPTRRPTNTAVIPVWAYVSGICNGCPDQVTRGDETVDGGRLLQDDEEWFRRLQSEATSNCFCPIGSEIVAPPTITELKTLFQAKLISAGFPYPLVSFEEVPVVDCTTPVSQFSFDFSYIVLLETDVTTPQVQAVGDVIRLTYNDVAKDFCDPADQTIDRIELISFDRTGTTDALCQEYNVTFRLTGRCRGCTNSEGLFGSSDSRRLSMNADPYEDAYPFQYPLLSFGNATFRTDEILTPSIMSRRKQSGRRLQAPLGDCFCDGIILDNQPPTVEQYNIALAAALNEFQLTNVCGLPNFVPTPEPTIEPAPEPAPEPKPEPKPEPTLETTPEPTPVPTDSPTQRPTASPITPSPMIPAPITPSPVTPAPVAGVPVTPAPVAPAALPPAGGRRRHRRRHRKRGL